MRGAAEQRVHRGLFGAASAVHDEHVVGDARHHAQVVRDHQDAQSAFLLEAGDQFEDLRLDGDVERGGRFVGDEQFGFAGQGHGDHGALAHAAEELVRVLPRPAGRFGDADLAEHVHGPSAGDASGTAEVVAVGLRDLFADRVRGVQRGQRVLEDHRHPASAQPAEPAVGQAEEFLSGEGDRSAHPGPAVQAHHGEGGDRLAGAGLADKTQGAAGRHGEGDPVDGLDGSGRGVEGDPQIVDAQQGVVRFAELFRFGGGRHGGGRHGQFLTLGSTTAYSRSMTTLAATMKKAASSVTPSTTGWSERCRAS